MSVFCPENLDSFPLFLKYPQIHSQIYHCTTVSFWFLLITTCDLTIYRSNTMQCTVTHTVIHPPSLFPTFNCIVWGSSRPQTNPPIIQTVAIQSHCHWITLDMSTTCLLLWNHILNCVLTWFFTFHSFHLLPCFFPSWPYHTLWLHSIWLATWSDHPFRLWLRCRFNISQWYPWPCYVFTQDPQCHGGTECTH